MRSCADAMHIQAMIHVQQLQRRRAPQPTLRSRTSLRTGASRTMLHSPCGTRLVAASILCLLITTKVAVSFQPPSLPSTSSAAANHGRHPSLLPASSEKIEVEDFEEYARCMSPREERKRIQSESKAYAVIDERPVWQKALLAPIKVTKKILPKKAKGKPGALILLRCGESTWNANQTFTGWADPDLTAGGYRECEHAARLLLAQGYSPDVVYTSRLKRAVRSAWTVLAEMDSQYLPVYKSFRLNERSYGALTGLSKKETAKELGADVVQAWRNSLKARPPPMKKTDPYYPGKDPRYADIDVEDIPLTESLLDCQERTRPLWEYKIKKDIENGESVLVIAHTNTLRGLIKKIDGINDDDIQDISMPNGVPFVYRFDKEMNPIKPGEDSLTQVHASGTFLEKPGLLKKALKRQEDWAKLVPGFDTSEVDTGAKRVTTLENSLLKLRNEQTVEAMVEESAASESDDGSEEFNGTDGNLKLMNEEKATLSTSQDYERWEDDPCEFEEFGFFASSDGKEEPLPLNVVPLPDDADSKKQEDAVVVLIRHGRTPHNNLGLFTGWEDPPLADDGVEDAKNAGRLLKRHGFEFDVVYTSWLTRAIQTAWYVMDELDVLWLPMVKSWRLNERMYGALTGKSKAMVANEYGEEQLKKWRRGFAIRPPPTSSYSFSYPGNDLRRTKYVKDLRISWSESIIRSIESRKLQIHRKFPKSESLKDCMARSIPFYTDRICNEAVNKGKRVLITSHENALRGILMHLCDIPVEAMNQLHLPNGLPLVYSVKGKCITLLDDGSGKDPMEEHDFGPAAKYLFKPCEITDEFYIEMEKRAKDVTAVVTADVAAIEKEKVAA